MKIQQVAIHHFRSVGSATLTSIRDFNVFIGRNNSGKSNLLSCIDLFFSCLRPGDVIVERPRIGAPLDFYEKLFTEPIDNHNIFLTDSR